jgi:phenylacetate 2-hydroxylase
LLYTALIRLICSYRIVASEEQPPNTDYVDYNQFKSALVAIPRDFKVKLIPRDGMDHATELGTLERCLEEARMRTENYYKEEEGVGI